MKSNILPEMFATDDWCLNCFGEVNLERFIIESRSVDPPLAKPSPLASKVPAILPRLGAIVKPNPRAPLATAVLNIPDLFRRAK